MNDVLIAFAAVFLAFQVMAFIMRALTRRHGDESHGFYALVLPLSVGLGLTVFVMTPHWLGSLTGGYHAASDIDIFESQSLSPWLLLVALCVGLRSLVQAVAELAVSLELWRQSAQASLATRAKLAQAVAKLGDTRLRIAFHRSARWTAPFLRGPLRPTVYLHVDLAESLSVEELHAALAHELGHRERGDQLMVLAYAFLIAPLDLFRLVESAYHSWAEAAERACDDRATALVGSGRVVAEALVAVVRNSHHGSPRHSVALCGEVGIRHRVERLLDDKAIVEPPAPLPRSVFSRAIATWILCAGVSALTPSYGLEIYCFLEHLVGTHCVV